MLLHLRNALKYRSTQPPVKEDISETRKKVSAFVYKPQKETRIAIRDATV